MISGHLNGRTESASYKYNRQKPHPLGYPNGDAASFDVYAFIGYCHVPWYQAVAAVFLTYIPAEEAAAEAEPVTDLATAVYPSGR